MTRTWRSRVVVPSRLVRQPSPPRSRRAIGLPASPPPPRRRFAAAPWAPRSTFPSPPARRTPRPPPRCRRMPWRKTRIHHDALSLHGPRRVPHRVLQKPHHVESRGPPRYAPLTPSPLGEEGLPARRVGTGVPGGVVEVGCREGGDEGQANQRAEVVQREEHDGGDDRVGHQGLPEGGGARVARPSPLARAISTRPRPRRC